MQRQKLVETLKNYNFIETNHALDILDESLENQVSYRDIRRVWDRVSKALDHHQEDENHLKGLQELEQSLADCGHLSNAPLGYQE
jgi:hypothetical protein